MEEILISLAIGALGFGIGTIARGISTAVEKRLEAFVKQYAADFEKQLVQQNEGWILDEQIKKQLEEKLPLRKALVSASAKGTGDAFKDGVKNLVGPKVKSLLEGGKKSIDAFFESQISSVTDASAQNFYHSEEARTSLLQLWSIRPMAPLIAARALRDAMQSQLAEAEGIQKTQTTIHWLSYLAQQKVGSETVQKGSDKLATTILHNVTERGDYQSRIDNVPGILFVDAYVEAVTEDRWNVTPIQGHLASVSQAMLSSLQGPASALKLPTVYRVSSLYKNDGLGRSDLPQSMWPGPYAFNLGINEEGKHWASKRYKRQRAALDKIGGEDKIYDLLGSRDLKSLNVTPDLV